MVHRSGSRLTASGRGGQRNLAFTGDPPPVGHYVRLANHSKVYQVTGADEVFPALVQDVPGGTLVNPTTMLRCKYSQDMDASMRFERSTTQKTIVVVEAL